MAKEPGSEWHIDGGAPALAAAQSNATARISIAAYEPSARISLRLRAQRAADIAHAGSMLIPMAINTCVVLDDRTVARLGPDEWLVLCSETDAEGLTAKFEAALRGTIFALTDISHRNVGIAVAGLNAREVINCGCPLDLSDARFPPGSATRTLLGKAEIVLLRQGIEAAYRIECWRSFAPYVHAFLKDGAREFEPT